MKQQDAGVWSPYPSGNLQRKESHCGSEFCLAGASGLRKNTLSISD